MQLPKNIREAIEEMMSCNIQEEHVPYDNQIALAVKDTEWSERLSTSETSHHKTLAECDIDRLISELNRK